ncbi:MAG: hypothetical protein NEHIOOID_00518 [Holosporales bacterium]
MSLPMLKAYGYTVKGVNLTKSIEKDIQAVKQHIESLKPKVQKPKKK